MLPFKLIGMAVTAIVGIVIALAVTATIIVVAIDLTVRLLDGAIDRLLDGINDEDDPSDFPRWRRTIGSMLLCIRYGLEDHYDEGYGRLDPRNYVKLYRDTQNDEFWE
jgi:hypothetical protein